MGRGFRRYNDRAGSQTAGGALLLKRFTRTSKPLNGIARSHLESNPL